MNQGELSINRCLPRLDTLRKRFASREDDSNKPQILCAWVDFNPSEDEELCAGVFIYAAGETPPDRHVFGGRHCVLITNCILPWLRGEIPRGECVRRIADRAIQYYTYSTINGQV